MDFRVLGPLGVTVDRSEVPLRARATTLLGLLLHRANRAIPGDVLMDRLWAGVQPRTADSAFRVHLAEVRRSTRTSVDGPSRLATTRGGYVLTVAPDELDAMRVEWAIARAPRLPEDERAALLREAMSEWRGEPYQGQDEIEELVSARISLQYRLVELRLALADADLAIGRADRVVAETTSWLAESPTSEAIARRLVVALYVAGTQVEALRAWRRFRDSMRDDYGLEPTAEFRRLELDLLDPRDGWQEL